MMKRPDHAGIQGRASQAPTVGVSLTLGEAHAAWQRARRRKKPSATRWRFERRWLDSLVDLTDTLQAGTWQPRHTQCFVVHRPKTREVHAPDFADRVLHHWLVPQLEAVFDAGFIHDSFANRRGKGTLAAVRRLQVFMRQRQDGRGGGWALKLDVHNCFNRIHRPTLYRLLVHGLSKAQRAGRLDDARTLQLRSLCHRLLAEPTRMRIANPVAHRRLPPHKRLDLAPAGRGIPVGNLTSQFFVNVYLDRLDQFVKHELKVRHYLRFVDDMVLLGDSASQLTDWRKRIAGFLDEQLGLTLRDMPGPNPLRDGLPFLGYRVYTSHLGVLQRSVQHCRQALRNFERRHVRWYQRPDGALWLRWRAPPERLQALHQQLASYWGHFGHAQAFHQRLALIAEFAWLQALFEPTALQDARLLPAWQPDGAGLSEQRALMAQCWPCTEATSRVADWVQCGALWQGPLGATVQVQGATARHRRAWQPYRQLAQHGWLRHGARRRSLVEAFGPCYIDPTP